MVELVYFLCGISYAQGGECEVRGTPVWNCTPLRAASIPSCSVLVFHGSSYVLTPWVGAYLMSSSECPIWQASGSYDEVDKYDKMNSDKTEITFATCPGQPFLLGLRVEERPATYTVTLGGREGTRVPPDHSGATHCLKLCIRGLTGSQVHF